MSTVTVVAVVTAPSTEIGPGLGAFFAFFVLALSLWLLMRNMNGRLRRMSYRDKVSTPDNAADDPAGPAADPVAEAPSDASDVEAQPEPTP
jgi:hypothetical protein